MDRTVVLITGCSSGIGLHLALRLASDPSRSFKVYATLRDLRAQGPLWEAARARGCPPGFLETLQLDVRDADSVAAARARVTEGRVDVLGLPFNAVYCASKFAIEGLCESLAVLLPPFGVHVSLIECGPVRTAFLEKQEGVPGGALDGADAETRVLFSRYQRHLERIFREAAQDPEEVTEVGAGRGPGTRDGARGVEASPRPAPGQPRPAPASPRPARLPPPPQVFLAALRAPRPALRYFSTESFLPLAHLRLADPSGCSYVAAMHRAVFADEPAEEETASDRGGPVLCAPPAAAAPQ
ncbi:17-beta-hydroxysteroid dehydrogenase type 1 isoform X3 [Halichoerus grypus]